MFPSSSIPYGRFAIGLLVALLGSLWMTARVSAQDRTSLPSEQYAASTTPTASVPLETLPPVDGAALRTQAEANADESGPYRFGQAVETNYSPERHGTWEQLPSGSYLWRLRVQSDNAVSLNFGFKHFQLPAGAELYVYGPNRKVVHGPYVRDDATKGQLWTPIVPGSKAVVELEVPKEKRSEVSLRLTKVSHGFRSLGPAVSKETNSASRACNIDVACPEADPWSDQVRSVGLYSINGEDACSGSLVNNTREDGTPYFLTAEHCLQGSEEAAASMVFYWNYQHPTCRPPDSDESGETTFVEKSNQTSSGALLRMSHGNCETTEGPCYLEDMAGKSDVTLVEIDAPLPPNYNLFLNGWDRSDFAPSEAVSIHHPSTHGKRITFDYDQTSITGLSDQSNDTHIRVHWDSGTTERGSSGGPLFDSSQQTVGVLSAGGAGCEIRDWYGRIHNAWDGGDTPDTQLRNWLDPNNSGKQDLDGRPVANDATPPAQVSDFSVANVTSSSITLQWTAPGDDGREGTADRYLLRYRTSTPQHRTDAAIKTREDFERANSVSSVPTPDSAGTPQSVTVTVNDDSSYYFALVAQDNALNASSLATINRDATPVSALQVTPPAPNPSRDRTTLNVVTEETQRVRIRLYDALGRQVSLLFDDEIPPYRQKTIPVDVSSLASGLYFARIRGSNGRILTRRISVMK